MILASADTDVAIPVAFIAGLASFLSPCVLPLLPGYLSYMSGVSVDAVRDGSAKARAIVPAALLFVLGFSIVFVVLGTTASVLSEVFGANQRIMTRIAGGFVILMGILFLGIIPVPWLYREKRFEMTSKRGVVGNLLMGMAFGFGWTPCIGPTLGATLFIASKAETAGKGALLLGVYSLGLGVPFLLASLGISRLASAIAWVRKHQRAMMRATGIMLIAFGILLATDQVFRLAILIQGWMEKAGLDGLVGI